MAAMGDGGVELDDDAELELRGGNVTPVHRRGGVVLRQAGPWTPTVHQVMRHARLAGAAGIPEPLGIADDGREALEFLEGVVPEYPMPSWIWHEAVLEQAARMLRSWHDATSDFDTAEAVWRLPAHEPAEVICHNDFAQYNLVFEPNADEPRLVGAIDFDTMSPGARIWDLAYLAYRLVPFIEESGDGTPDASARERRLRILMSAYGIEFARADLFASMSRRLVELAEFSDDQADRTGKGELARHARMYRDDAERVAAYG
jgi:hypothetical protein